MNGLRILMTDDGDTIIHTRFEENFTEEENYAKFTASL